MDKHSRSALSAALPASGGWEYGGHLYGIEPLALPQTWLPRPLSLKIPPHSQADEHLVPYAHLWTSPDTGIDLSPVDADEIDRLFWFRWITGHQTTFCLWQLLAAVLDEAAAPGSDADDLACWARNLVRGYSLMLLYASSPPQEVYDRVIRGPMARQHPNLSGAWAGDYAPVRMLIRGKTTVAAHESEAAALTRECELNERIHEGIAVRVVPSGVSLLLTTGIRQGALPLRRETLLWLYDGIFQTSRQQVPYEVVAKQLLRRLHAILLDISANGLYPACASDQRREPAQLMTHDAVALKNDFIRTLRRVAAFATVRQDEP